MHELRKRIERVAKALARGGEVPLAKRFWLALAESPAEYERMAQEPVTWGDVESDWWKAASETDQSTK